MIRSISLKKREIKKVDVDVTGSADIYVKEGDVVQRGDILYRQKQSKVVERLDIALELGLARGEVKDIAQVMDGQFVVEDTVVAQKTDKNALAVKLVYCEKSGIVDFSKIDEGIILIVDTPEDEVVVSNFTGQISTVKNGLHVSIDVDAQLVRTFAKKQGDNAGQLGEFIVIADGDGIYSPKELKGVDIAGKIVYGGRFLYKKLLNYLTENGAVAVVTHSMEYADYIDYSGNLAVLGGFGHVKLDSARTELVQSLKGSTVYFGTDPHNISFLGVDEASKSQLQDSSEDLLFKHELAAGDRVLLNNSDNFGNIGEVEQVDKDGGSVVVVVDDEKIEEDSSVINYLIL